MKSTDVSKQRQESIRRSGNSGLVGEPQHAAPMSWVVAAVVVIGLALGAILFMDVGDQRAATNVEATRPSGGEPADPAPEPATVPALDVPRELSRDAAASIPPQNADPDEIAAYEDALARRISARRKNAAQGDIFDPELVTFLERVTMELLAGDDGVDLLATVKESNPGYELEEGEVVPVLAVNASYPENAPLSTVPPLLLQAYPPLPRGFEYRFVGCRLLLLDRDARVILDYTEQCLW